LVITLSATAIETGRANSFSEWFLWSYFYLVNTSADSDDVHQLDLQLIPINAHTCDITTGNTSNGGQRQDNTSLIRM